MAEQRAHMCKARAAYCQRPLLTATPSAALSMAFNPAYECQNTSLISYLSGGNHHNLFKVVESHDCGARESSAEHAEGPKNAADACHEEQHTW